MAFRCELRFAGVGGQGNMLAGTIIAETAILHEHRFATQVPTYTSQVRGGPTKADVIISDNHIEFPEATHLDFMLALDQRTYDMYKGDLKNHALVLIDDNLVRISARERDLWDVYGFPIIRTAKYEVGNVLTANILAVGMTVELTRVVDKEHVRKILQSRIRPALLEVNMKAFDMGIQAARSLQLQKINQRAGTTLLAGQFVQAQDSSFVRESAPPT
jgi:2-oxoglutarate ferredoxin oxidoreductase subunit gamma